MSNDRDTYFKGRLKLGLKQDIDIQWLSFKFRFQFFAYTKVEPEFFYQPTAIDLGSGQNFTNLS